MEPIIENQVILSLPIFMEWRNSGKTDAYKKSIRNYSIFMTIVLAIVLFVFRNIGMPPATLITEIILIIAVYIWLVFINPRSRYKNQYKGLCASSNGTPMRIARFYEDTFTVSTESGDVREFSCDKITNIKETEHLYVIVIEDADIDVLLDKNGFLKGDIEQVKKLR